MTVSGDRYVIGGSTRVAGELNGDVTVLAGNLAVVEAATVTGTGQTIAGESTIADGASVGRVSAFEPPAPSNSPTGRLVGFLLQFLVVGSAGWWFARHRPTLLDDVGHSITGHALVGGVVGALAAATLLVLFVYTAFTLLPLPLSVAGLVGEVLVVLYSQVVFGHLVGRRLPIDRDGVATVAGVGLFLLALELLAVVPYFGTVAEFALIVAGFGAALNSCFGLQRFEPVTIPGALTDD